MQQVQPSDPQGWVNYLRGELSKQAAEVNAHNDYYTGEHSLSFVGPKYRVAFAQLLSGFADNFCGLIVDSVAERLQVMGFRLTEDPAADEDAWALWQANDMDQQSAMAMLDALVGGRSFVGVWAESDGTPVIRAESPTEVVMTYHPGTDVPAVAMKSFTDDWGVEHAVLFTADAVLRLSREQAGARWVAGEEYGNPLGVVPFVELRNRPRLVGGPSSELMSVEPLQDALNKVVRDALLASEFAAYPQRWVTGLTIDEDEEGNPKPPPFNAALDRLFQAEDPDTKFGQFAAADLGNYAKLAELLVQHMASVSRVPFHYFLLNGGQAPSGEAITSAEAGLVAKARDRQLHFGEAWERVIRLAFKVQGDPRANSASAETIWRDPEYRSQAQRVDALMKLATLGVPAQQLWEDAGYSPQQVSRFESMRAADALLGSALGLPPVEPVTPDADQG